MFRRLVLPLALLALVGSACDPGSRATIKPVGADACHVVLESREGNDRLDMTLKCSGPAHTDCTRISALSCGGADIPLTEPLVVEGCPQGEWCVNDCKAVEAPGAIWDTPALLKDDRCNPYKDR